MKILTIWRERGTKQEQPQDEHIAHTTWSGGLRSMTQNRISIDRVGARLGRELPQAANGRQLLLKQWRQYFVNQEGELA